MRILLLSNLYWPYILGGAEIVARDFAVALEGLGHEVMVLTSSYGLPKAQRDGRIWRTLHYTPPAHFDQHRPAWQQLNLLSDYYGKVPQDELIENYDNSEILLVPSLWKEPFGLVVAEAMARGLPVIASKIGGPAEIITHGVDGLLIEPGDERALVSAILQLVEDPAKRKQLALAAPATVRERFLITENRKRVEQHLSRVLQKTDSY